MKWKFINSFLLNNITYYSYLFTNMHKHFVHVLKLHQGDCLKEQYVNDNAPSINATNTESTSSCLTVFLRSVSLEHGPSVDRTAWSQMLWRGWVSLVTMDSDFTLPAWAPFVHFLFLRWDISQEQALNQDVLAWLLFHHFSPLGWSIR